MMSLMSYKISCSLKQGFLDELGHIWLVSVFLYFCTRAWGHWWIFLNILLLIAPYISPQLKGWARLVKEKF